jgi:hypothetical protein
VRNTPNCKAERYRLRDGPLGSDSTYGNAGVFRVPIGRIKVHCVISDEGGWDHVSVSIPGASRCPTWEEMCAVKELFFRDDEWVLQYHPAKAENISVHAYCLHLWRPQKDDFPKPPSIMV